MLDGKTAFQGRRNQFSNAFSVTLWDADNYWNVWRKLFKYSYVIFEFGMGLLKKKQF